MLVRMSAASSTTLGLLAGTIGPSSWPGVGFQVMFIVGFVLYLTWSHDHPRGLPS
jgi:hypothetical protein